MSTKTYKVIYDFSGYDEGDICVRKGAKVFEIESKKKKCLVKEIDPPYSQGWIPIGYLKYQKYSISKKVIDGEIDKLKSGGHVAVENGECALCFKRLVWQTPVSVLYSKEQRSCQHYYHETCLKQATLFILRSLLKTNIANLSSLSTY